MKLKIGVEIDGIKPELVLGIVIAKSVFDSFGQNLVITSVLDSLHSRDSLHYQGKAVDIRIKNLLPDTIPKIIAGLKASLPGFDVVLEDDHIHIEYDPR